MCKGKREKIKERVIFFPFWLLLAIQSERARECTTNPQKFCTLHTQYVIHIPYLSLVVLFLLFLSLLIPIFAFPLSLQNSIWMLICWIFICWMKGHTHTFTLSLFHWLNWKGERDEEGRKKEDKVLKRQDTSQGLYRHFRGFSLSLFLPFFRRSRKVSSVCEYI